MVEKTISLHSVEDVKRLVTLANSYDFDVHLSEGKYIIDAKSIMGVFSLDLAKQITIVADCDESSTFCADLKKFIESH